MSNSAFTTANLCSMLSTVWQLMSSCQHHLPCPPADLNVIQLAVRSDESITGFSVPNTGLVKFMSPAASSSCRSRRQSSCVQPCSLDRTVQHSLHRTCWRVCQHVLPNEYQSQMHGKLERTPRVMDLSQRYYTYQTATIVICACRVQMGAITLISEVGDMLFR